MTAPRLVRVKRGRIRLLPGEPRDFVNQPAGPIVRDLERRMRLVSGLAKFRVRVRTGLLLTTIRERTNIKTGKAGWPSVDVIAGKARGTDKYRTVPVIEDQGSRPHIIRARRKKALRFVMNGKVVIRTAVHHPGTKGSGFLTKSLEAAAG